MITWKGRYESNENQRQQRRGSIPFNGGGVLGTKEFNTMWIARDKNGNLFLYNTELTRNENGVWFPADYQPSNPFYCVKLPSDLFPEQTWEDAPLEVEIKRLSDR